MLFNRGGDAGESSVLLHLEHVQIEGDVFLGISGEEGGDAGGGLVFRDVLGELLDFALAVVGDAGGVEEGDEHLGLAFEQPDLEDLGGDLLVGAEAHLVEQPGGLIGLAFALDVNGAELAGGGEVGDDGAVGGALLGLEVADDLVLQFGADGLEQLDGGHEGLGKGLAIWDWPRITGCGGWQGDSRRGIGGGLPGKIALEGKEGVAAVLEGQAGHVRTGDTGGIDVDDTIHDGAIGGEGGDDALGDEDAEGEGIEAAAGELVKAERGHAAAGEHDGDAGAGLDDGGAALVEVEEAAVAGGGLAEVAVVEAEDAAVG